MTTRLIDCTKMMRSKNAGPLWLTIDLSFDDSGTMERVLASGILTVEKVAELYDVPAGQVKIIPYPIVHAVKITLPRKHPRGAPEDTDIYGCQQHMPLANLPYVEGFL